MQVLDRGLERSNKTSLVNVTIPMLHIVLQIMRVFVNNEAG